MSWASVYNYKYNQGCIVAMKEDRDLPVFAVVKNVCVYNTSRVIFQVQELLTLYFHRHLHAYNVELPTSSVITYTHQEQLLDPVPLSKLKLSQGYFIVCHHYITPGAERVFVHKVCCEPRYESLQSCFRAEHAA